MLKHRAQTEGQKRADGEKAHAEAEASGISLHGFCPPLPPIIMGGFNLKIFQNFVGTKIFLTYVGG